MTATTYSKFLSEEAHTSDDFEPLDWSEYDFPNKTEGESYNLFWFYCNVGERPEDPNQNKNTGVQIILDLNEKFKK